LTLITISACLCDPLPFFAAQLKQEHPLACGRVLLFLAISPQNVIALSPQRTFQGVDCPHLR
jgi:hypothetical protein